MILSIFTVNILITAKNSNSWVFHPRRRHSEMPRRRRESYSTLDMARNIIPIVVLWDHWELWCGAVWFGRWDSHDVRFTRETRWNRTLIERFSWISTRKTLMAGHFAFRKGIARYYLYIVHRSQLVEGHPKVDDFSSFMKIAMNPSAFQET